MNVSRSSLSIVVTWALAVVLIGGVLTSYHQPFHTPVSGVLALVRDPGRGSWRMLHVLSGDCGCSQRVMQHLLNRHPISRVTEQILLVEGDEPQSPTSEHLIARLDEQGFSVTRIAAEKIPSQTGLRGVPLLIIASPENKIVYMGGYGNRGDGDGPIFQRVLTGAKISPLPVIGCAVGRRLQKQADPFRIKY